MKTSIDQFVQKSSQQSSQQHFVIPKRQFRQIKGGDGDSIGIEDLINV